MNTTAPTPPSYKFSSNTDYTSPLTGLTAFMFALATVAILARVYARIAVQKVAFGMDDALAYLAWTGLVGNSAGNFLIAANRMVSTLPPTPSQATSGELGIHLVSGFYPYGMVAGKLSLLFLIRRIFTTSNKRFLFAWYLTFSLVFPIWFVLVYTWTGLSLHNQISLLFTFKYAAPIDSIITLFTDICILALPVGMISQLQLSWPRKLSIMAIFALGSIGTVISLTRAVLSIIQSDQNWDPRFSTYIEAVLGQAEISIVVICACLPATRPLFVQARSFALKALSSISFRSMTRSLPSRTTAISLESQGYNDEAPIRSAGNIHQLVEYDVAIEQSKNSDSAKYPHSHLQKQSGATVSIG